MTITFGRNTERLKGLWPSAMLPSDWLDLWRQTFTHKNQDWLAEAMQRVRLRYSSAQPELRWFVDAFREIEREQRTVERESPDSPARKPTREQEQAECDADYRMMLSEVLACEPFVLWEAIDHMKQGPMAGVVSGLGPNPRMWSRFSLGMVWAAIELQKPGARELLYERMGKTAETQLVVRAVVPENKR
jgi:hypothetical protein